MTSIAIVGATLIDGTGAPPVTGATIVIENGRFTAVGPTASTPSPPGAEVVDARGKFVIPGLVDMHVHVYTPEKWHPELYLAAGVTTVLDLGGQLENVVAHRAAIESGARQGPRCYFTGPLLEEGELFEGFAGFSRKIDAARIEDTVDGLADAGVAG
ncbi:MAG: amidohydrolase, partial [Candidatus Rokuibacteriota bacterium]